MTNEYPRTRHDPPHAAAVGDGGGPQRAHAVVFAPFPWLEVVIDGTEAAGELHLHAAGQGCWIGRLLHTLGTKVTMCSTFGGESGAVVRALMEPWSTSIRHVWTVRANGWVVTDHRGTQPAEISSSADKPLSRHETDDLYGITLVEGLNADVIVLGGPNGNSSLIDSDIYRRLATDLRNGGGRVVADLSREPLDAVLAAGVSVLKVSVEDLHSDGRLADRSDRDLYRLMRQLHDCGADQVIVTRGAKGTLGLLDGDLVQATGPSVVPVEPRGAGDSLTAGVAAALAAGSELTTALRLGVAAATLNVTRHGLASGTREEIERLAAHVEIRPVKEG